MYKFKKELKNEALKGRTITYLANEIGITKVYLTNILNGKRECSKVVAYSITKVLNNEKELKDYFVKKEVL